MGAWGTYPKDSDGAMDLVLRIGNVINAELEKMTPAIKDTYEYAGLIMVLLQNGFFLKYKFIASAVNSMRIELDKAKNGNKSGWQDVKKFMQDIEYLIEEFEKPLAKEREFFLTTTMLGGKNISKRSEKWRLAKLDEYTMSMPKNWLLREEERSWTTHSGLLDMLISV